MTTEELLQIHDRMCRGGRDIMSAKNHDYRGGSNSDPFANFRGSTSLGINPILGILLRMQDKMMRIKTFAEKGELKVKGEGIDDALQDLINYAVLIKGMITMDYEYAKEEPNGNEEEYNKHIYEAGIAQAHS